MKIRRNYYIAGFFFLMQILIIYANYPMENINVFFWFCNHIPLFFGIAFLLNNHQAIKAFINVGFLGQLVWTIDFFSRILFGVNILNVTGYLFESESVFQWIIVLMIHVLSTFVALYFTYNRKPKLKALLISFFYLLLIYFTTLSFTPEENNINWVFMIGFGLNVSHELYVLFWPVIAFVLVVLPTQGIQYGVYKYSRKLPRKRVDK